MSSWRQLVLSALPLVLALSCDEEGSVALDAGQADGAAVVAECGPGLAAYGSACVPELDDCPTGQVPAPGGGCVRVGAEACSVDGVPGLKVPPDWACRRIGVEECDNGWGIRGPPDWTCKPVGPPRTCLPGWATVAGGWCEPILPQGKSNCPAGTMEVIGQSTCQAVGDCGSGTWGQIKTTAQTVFVEQAYQGGDADGSQAKPFPTVGQAVAAAADGGQIAVAAGTYAEDVVSSKQLKLEGRCPQLVTIQGQTAGSGMAAVTLLGHGSTLRGVTVTGPASGIWIEGAQQVTVEEVVVTGCGAPDAITAGVVAASQAEPTLRGLLISGVTGYGVEVNGAEVTVEQCTVRGTQPRAGPKGGEAIFAHPGPLGDASTLTVQDSVLLDNFGCGLYQSQSSTTLERSAIIGSQRHNPADVSKAGVDATGEDGPIPATTLVLRDCLVAENRTNGVGANGADVTIERSVIRDTLPRLFASWSGFGSGITVFGDVQPASLWVRDSLVTGNHVVNIELRSASAAIESTVVKDGRPNTDDNTEGEGIAAYVKQGVPCSFTVKGSVVAGNHRAGMLLQSAKGTVERSVIRDTLEEQASGEAGDGLFARHRTGEGPASLTVRDCLLSNNRRWGVGALFSKVEVERSVVRDTRVGENGRWGVGVGAATWEVPPKGLPRSTVAVADSLLLDNSQGGVDCMDSDVTVERTVVQGPRSSGAQGDGRTAGMIHVASVDRPATLVVRDSAVADAQGAGIAIASCHGTVERTVVRDIKSTSPDFPGFGIVGFAWVGTEDQLAGQVGSPAKLDVRDSVVERCPYIGIAVADASGTLERVAVRQIQEATDALGETLGVGIYASAQSAKLVSHPTSLVLRHSAIKDCSNAGLLLGPGTAKVHGTVVQGTRASAAGFGDGIAAWSVADLGSVDLTLEDSAVESSDRAGLLLNGGTGAVRRSVFRKGTFSIVLDDGADPEIADSNVMEDNTEDRISYGEGLAAPSPPTLPPPPPMPSVD